MIQIVHLLRVPDGFVVVPGSNVQPFSLVTLYGMVNEVRLMQEEKVYFSMLVMLLGRVTDVKSSQFSNAPISILVTLLGMAIDVIPHA